MKEKEWEEGEIQVWKGKKYMYLQHQSHPVMRGCVHSSN